MFLSTCRRLYGTKKGIESSVFLGKRYEESCQELLRKIGIDTRLLGGPSDGGVDLQGLWYLCHSSPSDAAQPAVFKVIAQCKYITKDCPPSFVRELEGTLSRWPDTLGILISSTPASKACIEAVFVSPSPLLFLQYDMERLRRAIGNIILHGMLPNLVIGSRHVDGAVEPVFLVKE